MVFLVKYHLRVNRYAQLAQLVEQRTENPRVSGSIPELGILTHNYINIYIKNMYLHEWLSWWSTTLPRSGSRVRVPSRAFLLYKKALRLKKGKEKSEAVIE